MDEVVGFERDTIHLDDEIMFEDWVVEYLAKEKKEKMMQDQFRMLSRDAGWELVSPLAEDSFRLSLESVERE